MSDGHVGYGDVLGVEGSDDLNHDRCAVFDHDGGLVVLLVDVALVVFGVVGQYTCGSFGVLGVADGDLDEFGTGLVLEFVGGTLGDDLAEVDDGDFMGELVCFFEVLGGE